jgi:hypothetical protein
MPLTYEPIATTTVSGGSTNTVTFSSIPSTYTDLILIYKATANTPTTGRLTFNSNTSSIYSETYLEANGSSVSTARQNNQPALWPGSFYSTGITNGIIHINNYKNTTTFKTALIRTNFTTFLGYNVGTFGSTSAITSISIATQSGTHYFGSDSIFTIYGIKEA